MNTERHIENIIAQTSGMIMDKIGNCIHGDGVLNIREVEELVRLAVNCGYVIGIEQVKSEQTKKAAIANHRPVIRMNSQLKELETYESITEAAKDVYGSRKAIHKAIRYGGFSAGYKWKYA